MITPFNNSILVKLLSNYKHAVTTDARTVETKSKGLCVDISEVMDIELLIKANLLVEKVVFFDEFEDTTNYTIDGEKYALININKITGYDK